jgi:hypothetical protein
MQKARSVRTSVAYSKEWLARSLKEKNELANYDEYEDDRDDLPRNLYLDIKAPLIITSCFQKSLDPSINKDYDTLLAEALDVSPEDYRKQSESDRKYLAEFIAEEAKNAAVQPSKPIQLISSDPVFIKAFGKVGELYKEKTGTNIGIQIIQQIMTQLTQEAKQHKNTTGSLTNENMESIIESVINNIIASSNADHLNSAYTPALSSNSRKRAVEDPELNPLESSTKKNKLSHHITQAKYSQKDAPSTTSHDLESETEYSDNEHMDIETVESYTEHTDTEQEHTDSASYLDNSETD